MNILSLLGVNYVSEMDKTIDRKLEISFGDDKEIYDRKSHRSNSKASSHRKVIKNNKSNE